MSNSITLVGTTFSNTAGGYDTYGFRMYDDHDAAYCNLMSEEQANTTNEELFKMAANEFCDDSINAMVDFALDHGMIINDTWYSSEEVADMLATNEETNHG